MQRSSCHAHSFEVELLSFRVYIEGYKEMQGYYFNNFCALIHDFHEQCQI